jgi:hypothetical protein
MRAVSPLLLAAVLGLSSLSRAQEPAFFHTFHSFDFPGATDTEATSMSHLGGIVGRYYNPDGSHHGFLLQGGTFSTIDFPGAVLTDPEYVNDRGVIVGYYNDGQFNHGYRQSQGQFSTIDYPGFPNAEAAGIGDDGEIVGGMSDDYGTNFRGFLLNHGVFSQIVFPGASIEFQEATMISAGRIVGGYIDAAGAHGYLLAGGYFQSIDCPNAPGGVFLSAIDSLGRMSGEMTTADGHSHGLVVSNGECIAVDFPGSTATYANSIDASGTIAGRYTDAAGHTHGFFVEHIFSGWEP